MDNLTSRTELTKIIISHDNEVLEKCNELYEVKNNKIIKINEKKVKRKFVIVIPARFKSTRFPGNHWQK